jgi:hypothetical protein
LRNKKATIKKGKMATYHLSVKAGKMQVLREAEGQAITPISIVMGSIKEPILKRLNQVICRLGRKMQNTFGSQQIKMNA